ncbi:MAG: hypothetical protein PHW62_00480 [Candidatus Ratteibacteria bacterium]|nr:hypothetical protein [Candidatus Ratteibacteria bacterium]
MNLKIFPQKMESGMIHAIQVDTDGKTEVFNIQPVPFDTFEAMKVVLSKYYETEELWEKAKQEYDFAKQRFDLIDFRHTAALQDFKLLISPKKEPTIIKLPVTAGITSSVLPDTEKQKEQSVERKEEQLQVPPKPEERIILPPDNTTVAQAQQASLDMQNRAEQVGEDLKNTPVIISGDMRLSEPIPEMEYPDSKMAQLMQDHPGIITAEVKELLPERAKTILNNMEKHVAAGKDATDMTKPLKVATTPVSAQDWVTEISTKIAALLENTEFDESRLDKEIILCGVPEKILPKVKTLLIKSWENDNRFEKEEEPALFAKLRALLPGGKKKTQKK